MENEKEKLEKLREIIGEILYGINSDFKYLWSRKQFRNVVDF